MTQCEQTHNLDVVTNDKSGLETLKAHSDTHTLTHTQSWAVNSAVLLGLFHKSNATIDYSQMGNLITF